MESRGVVQRIDGVPCLVLRRRQMEERPDEPLIHLESYNKGLKDGEDKGYPTAYEDGWDAAMAAVVVWAKSHYRRGE